MRQGMEGAGSQGEAGDLPCKLRFALSLPPSRA